MLRRVREVSRLRREGRQRESRRHQGCRSPTRVCRRGTTDLAGLMPGVALWPTAGGRRERRVKASVRVGRGHDRLAKQRRFRPREGLSAGTRAVDAHRWRRRCRDRVRSQDGRGALCYRSCRVRPRAAELPLFIHKGKLEIWARASCQTTACSSPQNARDQQHRYRHAPSADGRRFRAALPQRLHRRVRVDRRVVNGARRSSGRGRRPRHDLPSPQDSVSSKAA